jgi:hypothetical protein
VLVWLAIIGLATASAPRTAADCPPLFGTAAERSANTRHRAQLLKAVVPGEYVIDIVHQGDWTKPQPLRLRNVKLAAAKQAATATVSVAADLAEAARCAPGEYVVRTDDKIGRKNVVLAVLDGVLLLERDGALVFLTPPGAPEPVFRLTWQSSIGLRHQR